MTQQLKYYKEYQSKLAALIGQKNATAILSDALYIVSTGTGDFIQNYYHNTSLSSRYNVNSYCDLLISIFSGFANVSTVPPPSSSQLLYNCMRCTGTLAASCVYGLVTIACAVGAGVV